MANLQNCCRAFAASLIALLATSASVQAQTSAPSTTSNTNTATLVVVKTIATDRATGKEHSLVTLFMSGGVPVTATAVLLKDAAPGEIGEARYQDARRGKWAKKPSGIVSSFTCVPSTTPEYDIDLVGQTNFVWIYLIRYSNGAEQTMTIHKETGATTFGPVVGGC
jgi:hypothetical protein